MNKWMIFLEITLKSKR